MSPFDYELVRLANGVCSIRSKAESETFHPVVGPVEEAKQLYVEQLHLPERIAAANDVFTIWDVGLGAAANVLTVIANSSQKPARLRILSFDHTLAPLDFAIQHAAELEYPSAFLSSLKTLLDESAVSFQEDQLQIDWKIIQGDFPTLISRTDAESWPKPDAILFDAFSPAKNPAMWTLPLFRRLNDLLDPQRPCAMPTYSRSTMLRVTLLLAGFFVGTGRAIAEKDETTIAANDRSLLRSPLPLGWLKRAQNSTSAEPLTSPAYKRARITNETFRLLQDHPQFRP